MTYLAFLDCLRHTPRQGWRVDRFGTIRYCEAEGDLLACPISALVGLSTKAVFLAAARLSLDRKIVLAVIDASDFDANALDASTAAIRRDLLEACGLSEGSAAA